MKICERCHVPYDDQFPKCPAPDCNVVSVKGLAFPKEGGQLMYIKGYRYPVLGFPTKDTTESMDIVKRSLRETLVLKAKSPFFFFEMLVMRGKLLRDLVAYLENVYSGPFKRKVDPAIDKNLICRSAREFFRVLTLRYGDRDWIRCLIGMYENDTAYRYRIQDIVAEVDRPRLARNVRREIGRLFDVYAARERGEGVAAKMRLLRRITMAALFLSPSLRKEILAFFQELDLERVAMTQNDEYWVGKIHSFFYDFQDHPWQIWQAIADRMDEGWVEEAVGTVPLVGETPKIASV
jgi:hypothetical protein